MFFRGPKPRPNSRGSNSSRNSRGSIEEGKSPFASISEDWTKKSTRTSFPPSSPAKGQKFRFFSNRFLKKIYKDFVIPDMSLRINKSKKVFELADLSRSYTGTVYSYTSLYTDNQSQLTSKI